MEDDLYCCVSHLKHLVHYQPGRMFKSWMFSVHNPENLFCSTAVFLCDIRQVMEPFLALVYRL